VQNYDSSELNAQTQNSHILTNKYIMYLGKLHPFVLHNSY